MIAGGSGRRRGEVFPVSEASLAARGPFKKAAPRTDDTFPARPCSLPASAESTRDRSSRASASSGADGAGQGSSPRAGGTRLGFFLFCLPPPLCPCTRPALSGRRRSVGVRKQADIAGMEGPSEPFSP